MEAGQIAIQIRNLLNPDPSERRTAAEALGRSDERAVYPLLRTLKDENPGVQDAAIRSLVSIGGEVTAYMALPLLRENPFLRNAARVILAQIGAPSIPLLRPLLADKDDDIRTFALDLIAGLGSCDYVSEITRLLEADPNQNVRCSAARALGALNDRQAVPALIAALKDNEWVCFSALEALSLLNDESAVGPVSSLLDNPSEALRLAAIEALGKLGSSLTNDMLLSRLPQASALEKSFLIKSIVQTGVTPAMTSLSGLLLEMLKNGEWDERLIAIAGLTALKDEHSIPALLDAAGSLDPSDPDSEERLLTAKNALMKFGCAERLISALCDPALKFRGKVLAAEVLGEMNCAEAVPRLAGLLEGDLREVRRASARALALICTDDALITTRQCVDDRDGHVRRAAIEALGTSRDTASFPRLFERLSLENYDDVLDETVRSLLKIDSDGLLSRLGSLSPHVKEIVGRHAVDEEILLALSHEKDRVIKVSALFGLGRTRGESGRLRLNEALGDADPEARKAAVLALTRRSGCFEELKAALGDEDQWVRLYAVKGLGDTGRPELSQALIPLLSDSAVPVVIAAVDALVRLGEREAVELSALRNHHDAAVREKIEQVAGNT